MIFKNDVCFKLTIKSSQLLLILLIGNHVIGQSKYHGNLWPEARSGYSMSYDKTQQSVVLFGGQDSLNNFYGDTWTWNRLQGWNKMDVNGPSPRINSSMTFDDKLGGTILFGGLTKEGSTNDLWLLKEDKWRVVSKAKNPPARQLGTMAYNSNEELVVLFGGRDDNSERLGDTWVYNHEKWKKLASGPSARSSHTMTYYPINKSILVYGGYNGDLLGDLWELIGTKWTKIESMSGPERIHSSLSFDSENNRLLLFGGFGSAGRTNDLWSFSGTRWEIMESRTSPNPRAEHESVYIPEQGLFVFGGVIGKNPKERIRANDTWVYKNRWKNMN